MFWAGVEKTPKSILIQKHQEQVDCQSHENLKISINHLWAKMKNMPLGSTWPQSVVWGLITFSNGKWNWTFLFRQVQVVLHSNSLFSSVWCPVNKFILHLTVIPFQIFDLLPVKETTHIPYQLEDQVGCLRVKPRRYIRPGQTEEENEPHEVFKVTSGFSFLFSSLVRISYHTFTMHTTS